MDGGNLAGEKLIVSGTSVDLSGLAFTHWASGDVVAIQGSASQANDLQAANVASRLYGGALGDILHDGAGADVLSGGKGNDTYYVHQTNDQVVEILGGGFDTVHATCTFSAVGEYIETIDLDGSAAINATGDGLDNAINGNLAKNVIDGGKGADTMSGGGGNDTYYVDNTGDKVIEVLNAGQDSVASTVTFTLGTNVENLYLTGSAAVGGTGNASANRIRGNNAANLINAGRGDDTLTGLGGADIFVYHAGWGKDTITDFKAGNASGHDSIYIDKSQFADFAHLLAHVHDTSAGTVITHDALDTITLDHVHKASLTAADFKFR